MPAKTIKNRNDRKKIFSERGLVSSGSVVNTVNYNATDRQ